MVSEPMRFPLPHTAWPGDPPPRVPTVSEMLHLCGVSLRGVVLSMSYGFGGWNHDLENLKTSPLPPTAVYLWRMLVVERIDLSGLKLCRIFDCEGPRRPGLVETERSEEIAEIMPRTQGRPRFRRRWEESTGCPPLPQPGQLCSYLSHILCFWVDSFWQEPLVLKMVWKSPIWSNIAHTCEEDTGILVRLPDKGQDTIKFEFQMDKFFFLV